MRNLYLLLGGVALLEIIRRPQIGKIVNGRPPGVTQCLDGKWSTYRPGRGVCSYHGGWKGTVLTEGAQVFIMDLDRSIPGLNDEDIRLHRQYLIQMYSDLSVSRNPAQQKEFDQVWRKFVGMYTEHINEAYQAKLLTTGREKATTQKGKAARSRLNQKIRSFEKLERVLYNILRSSKYGDPSPIWSTLKERSDASTKRESYTYWGDTPADFRPGAPGNKTILL